jgi:hypothetical protein
MASAEAPDYEFQICEQCEEQLAEQGIGISAEDIYEGQLECHFDLAIALMWEGHILARSSQDRAISIVLADKEKEKFEIAEIEIASERALSYAHLTNQDILASDWTIVKLNNKESVEKNESDTKQEEN